ncbi:MAG: hypothetical protein R3B72_27380 [Polyangiaceae bacterium]
MQRRTILTLALLAAPIFTGCAMDLESADDVDESPTATSEDELSVFDWSANDKIPNTSVSDPPALAAYHGKVHLVHTGLNGFVTETKLFHRIFDGTSWSEEVEIPGQRSKAQPALASLGTKGSSVLHMVHQGETSNNLWWSQYDGVGWTNDSQLQWVSVTAPVMATLNGRIHLFRTLWSKGQSDLNVWENIYDGNGWGSSQHVVNGISSVSVAYHAGSLVLVTTDDDNNLFMRTSTGAGWSNPQPIPGQKSKAAVGLASFAGLLHMTHLGDTSNSIWWSTWDGASWTNNVTIPNQLSRGTPALAAAGSQLVMVHNGDSLPDLWFSTME